MNDYVDIFNMNNQVVQVFPTSTEPSIGHILGGKSTSSRKWPWMAMIQERKKGKLWEHICGGSLISTSWVVTAAHCIVKILDKSKIKVRVGTEAFNTSDATQNVQMFDVGNIYIHPKYKSIVLFNYDIALIKLKKPARLEEFVNTICVDEKGVDSDNCWIAGINLYFRLLVFQKM